jgi:acyl-CoA dehydrogenase
VTSGLDLDWPFFDPVHRNVANAIDRWCGDHGNDGHGDEVDSECRLLVRSLGEAGLLKLCVGEGERMPDVRSLAIARARLARSSGLADFAFAMQGLGSGAISLFGDPAQKADFLVGVSAGSSIAAFALTEPETGSDAANIACTARRDGDEWVINGEKSYISNGTIADVITLFARTSDEGARGISAFIVPVPTAGLSVAERIQVIAPHPLARLKFDNVRLPARALLGNEGAGFQVAMQTLNLFRVTVGAAALGFAQRALDEALAFAGNRRLGDARLSDNAVTQERLAEMALAIDGSALLIARAAWQHDQGVADNRRAAAMAKLHATEEAQRVIDLAVQLHGGLGVTRGAKVEELYREIRSLRIYEGASEVQRMIIARDLIKEHRA